jgi:RNA polymerase sigma-70 factor (ECF subfamily)
MGEKEEKSLTRSALEALYIELEKPMYNIVYRWLWDREESLDVVQEAFLRLWRMRHRIDLERIKPLAYRIALNIASNRRRARRFWRGTSLEALSKTASSKTASLGTASPGRASGASDSEDQLANDQELQLMRQIVETLPEKLKKVVMLCDFSDMTYEEVGKVLGIPPGTVGSRRNKALKILRESFEALMKRGKSGV